MKRNIPVQLLEVLENLISCCHSYVKWNNVWSSVLEINFGARQGSVLSPFLFAVYLDDLSRLESSVNGCHIILYADDILLLSPSVTRLQHLLHKCEVELAWLDMSINFSKSSCLRIGPRNDVVCATITSSTGHSIPCTSEIRYLGVYLIKFRTVKCSLVAVKRGFSRHLTVFSEKSGILHRRK